MFINVLKTLKELGVDLSALVTFKTVDESRCLNNPIKHRGKVFKELAQYVRLDDVPRPRAGLQPPILMLTPLG